MWVLIKSRKFMVSLWGVWELASPTEVVGVRRTWTFPCQVLISRMFFILKKGQFIPLAVVIAGHSQVLFCIVVYWWKGIWGPGNFICLFKWGVFLCDQLRESISSFVFLNSILYPHHRLLDRSEAWFASWYMYFKWHFQWQPYEKESKQT